MSFDIFISHASEDKDDLARPLAQRLQCHGLTVWFDEFSLRVGDSLSESIDRGLTQSRFGVVILSQHFFAKRWTKRELRGLVNQEINRDSHIILPIWHDVTHEEVAEFSAPLADVVALSSDLGIDKIAYEIISTINGRSLISSYITRPPEKETDNNNNANAADSIFANIDYASEFLYRLFRRIQPEQENKDDEHVSKIAAALAMFAGCEPNFIAEIQKAAKLRDIGQIAIPKSIVMKPGKLDAEEFNLFRQHTVIGHRILSAIDGLSMAARIARSHHEKWNGDSFPDALEGENIPLEARIVALADVYNALVKRRAYKEAWDHPRAVMYLNKHGGEHFDPALIHILNENDSYFRETHATETTI